MATITFETIYSHQSSHSPPTWYTHDRSTIPMDNLKSRPAQIQQQIQQQQRDKQYSQHPSTSPVAVPRPSKRPSAEMVSWGYYMKMGMEYLKR